MKETWLFIGATGVGKSTLISTLTNKEIKVSSGWKHCTTTPQLFSTTISDNICVLDTQGVGDLSKKNTSEILQDILNYLGPEKKSINVKIIWVVKPDIRASELTQQQAKFINKLDSNIWKSVVIFVKQGTDDNDSQGAHGCLKLLNVNDIPKSYNIHIMDANPTKDYKTHPFYKWVWKNDFNERAESGTFFKTEVKSFICDKVQKNISPCRLKFRIEKYHPQSTTEWYHNGSWAKYHDGKVENYHKGQLKKCHDEEKSYEHSGSEEKYHPGDPKKFHPRDKENYHSPYYQKYHPGNDERHHPGEWDQEYHPGTPERYCPGSSEWYHYGSYEQVSTGGRVWAGVLTLGLSEIALHKGEWECCGRSDYSDSGCEQRMSCCHRSSNRGCSRRMTCCGSSSISGGCKKRWSCCQSSDEYNSGCTLRMKCCPRATWSEGCQTQYICCERDVRTDNQGCKQRMPCCGEKIGSEGCQTHMSCCEESNTSGCELRMSCCKKEITSKTCKYWKLVCCGSKTTDGGCQSKWSCCDKKQTSTENNGCEKRMSCCDNATNSSGCKNKMDCCGSKQENVGGCKEKLTCCGQKVNSQGCQERYVV